MMPGVLGRGGMGRGYGTVRQDVAPLIRERLELAVASCKREAGAGAARLTLESTGVEVVDVTLQGPNQRLNSCITEAAWAMVLPQAFAKRYSQVVHVQF